MNCSNGDQSDIASSIGSMQTPTSSIESVLIQWRSRCPCHLFGLHAIDVELARRRRHLLHHLVEIEARGLGEANRVNPRDDERPEIRTGETASLELLDDRGDAIVDLQDEPCPAFALADGF